MSSSALTTPQRSQVDLFDHLHAKLPLPATASNPDLSKFQKSLERHYSDKRQSPGNQRPASPASDRGTHRQDDTASVSSSSTSSRRFRSRAPPPVAIRMTMTRPPSELFLPTPPPVFATYEQAPFLNTRASLAVAMTKFDVLNSPSIAPIPTASQLLNLPKSSTFPASQHSRQESRASSRSLPARTRSILSVGSSSRGAGVRPAKLQKRSTAFSGIDKDVTAVKRATAIAHKRRTGGSALSKAFQEEFPKSPVVKPSIVNIPIQMPWRRGRRGETMSMLLDSGFFPVNELIYKGAEGEAETGAEAGTEPKTEAKGVNASKRNSMRLNLNLKDLPPTPISIIGTPIDLDGQGMRSPVSPQSPRRIARNRLSSSRRRSALLRISGNGLPSTPSSLSPGRELGIITEDEVALTEVPMASEEPVATEIHLATGTVLTVTPPELTAWQRSIYIQGPIKLPKPVVVPRKDSIASLEPFQEAVDRFYQHALLLPRRRSDDAAYDDICGWYDDFGFMDVSFDHDRFSLDVLDDSKSVVSERFESETRSRKQSEQIIQPPSPAPVEREVAAVMLQSVEKIQAKLPPKPRPTATTRPQPPEHSESTASVASIKISSPAPSATNSERGAEPQVVSLLPLAVNEPRKPRPTSLISTLSTPSIASSGSNPLSKTESKSSFDWDVEETSSNSTWIHPPAAKKKRVASRPPPKKNPNAVMKMRRFVQTATAIL